MEPKIQVLTTQGLLVCSCGSRSFKRADPSKYSIARYLCYNCGRFCTDAETVRLNSVLFRSKK